MCFGFCRAMDLPWAAWWDPFCRLLSSLFSVRLAVAPAWGSCGAIREVCRRGERVRGVPVCPPVQTIDVAFVDTFKKPVCPTQILVLVEVAVGVLTTEIVVVTGELAPTVLVATKVTV